MDRSVESPTLIWLVGRDVIPAFQQGETKAGTGIPVYELSSGSSLTLASHLQSGALQFIQAKAAPRLGLIEALGSENRRLAMALTGGCYCGALRFEVSGDIPLRALCLCTTCQKISGGAGNLFIGIEASNFRYTQGEPRRFRREGTEDAPTREFCGECGVHIAARSPKIPSGVVVKVGTLDDPSAFDGPKMVFWTQEKKHFHVIPDGAAVYNTLPGR